jgi:hypothetical protein
VGVSAAYLRKLLGRNGAPRPDAAKTYAVAEVVAWHKENTKDGSLDDQRKANLRKTNAQAAILEIQLAEAERRSIPREEVERLLLHLAALSRATLYQLLENELPPRCEGLTAAQLRPIFRESADKVADTLSDGFKKWNEGE